MKRKNLLIAASTAAIATVLAYYDISLMPLIIALGILTVVVLVLHLFVATFNDWLNRRRIAAYPEWEAILTELREGKREE